jgi:hypothetical protein
MAFPAADGTDDHESVGSRSQRIGALTVRYCRPTGRPAPCPCPRRRDHFVNRLWSRFGVRTLAVALLSVGVAGGYYLGEDRETQQQGIDAQLASNTDKAELEYLHERHAQHVVATAEKRTAEYEAGLRAAEAAKAAAERAAKAEAAAASRKRRANEEKAAKPYDGPIPESCNEFSGNRKVGCAILLTSGFAIDQMPCLDKLWTKESGWNPKALNSASGAYGIAQATPGSKMASVGADWKTSVETQVKWGLGYIKDRYDTPCKAWAKSQSSGWY